MTIESEVQSLRQVSMFRDIDPAKLKLLAFTSERLSYDKDDVLFHQHEISNSTYVIIEGKVEVWLSAGNERIKVTELGEGAMVERWACSSISRARRPSWPGLTWSRSRSVGRCSSTFCANFRRCLSR